MMMMSQTVASSIHFENWTPNCVADWLKGLDDAILPYGPLFIDNNIDGKRLLMITPYDLEKIGIHKLGHQELIMEAVDQLRALRYGYETENLQHLALQLGCKARSLHNEIQAKTAENDKNRANVSPGPNPRRLSASVLSALADMIMSLKNIVSWLDRSPFESIYGLCLLRNTIVKLGIDLVTASQQEAKQNDVEDTIMKNCNILAEVCDELVKNNKESLVVQPASLEEATIRKKPGEELGMHIQTVSIGIQAYVIGGIKTMSPADLCGKIEKGDEVIQVNHKTVVGWQLTKLVNTLKEKPKEVTLLLKKRPHHISPYGHVPNKKKAMTKNAVSTLPKSTKKRRSRESDNKQQRPSLQELTSNVIVDDIESPREERTSDEKDDGNDTDNDVFRSGSESPQYVKPTAADPKQRRATVSGGSPTLSRPLLVIEDIDTPTRPKSFTVAATDAPQIEFKNLGIPGEESNLLRLGDASKIANAQQKRQEFRSARSTPPSLEFTVKKPTPIVQLKLTKPEQDSKQENTVDKATEESPGTPKSALELLEVPSRFQNFSGQSSGTDEEGDSTESGQQRINATSSSDTLTEDTLERSQENLSSEQNQSEQNTEEKTAVEKDTNISSQVKVLSGETTPENLVTKSDNMAGSTTDDPNTEGTQNEQAMDPNGNNQNNNIQNVSNDQVIAQNSNNTISTDANSNPLASAPTIDNTAENQAAQGNSSDSDAKRKPPKPIPAERHSKVKQTKSQIPQTAPRELHAGKVDFEKRRMVPAAAELALPAKARNQPTLMMIRKRESVTQADVDKRREEQDALSPQRKEEQEARDTFPDEVLGGYKIVIANGVPQKIPLTKQSSSESPVQMRSHRKKTKKVNRRVSCKDLGEGDCQGWLYREKSKGEGPLAKHWLKRWCVLKRHNLFCYRDNEDLKAESVIHLPAFQVSPAPEIKTKKFAFKIHNSGTMFVFASERQDDMSKWMNKLGLASIEVNPSEAMMRVHKTSSPPNDDFSESENEEDGNTSKSSDGSASIPDSPDACKRSTGSEEDVTVMMRNITGSAVTIDGKDKSEERRKTLGRLSDNDVSSAQVKIRRMHSLQRTLKAKEKELADIEQLLVGKSPKELLKTYGEKYLETSTPSDVAWQSSDSDSDVTESTVQ